MKFWRLFAVVLLVVWGARLAYGAGGDSAGWPGGVAGGTGTGGTGAPVNNPPGGANNYAPIDSPVFTTALTLPVPVTCTGGQVLSGFAANLTPSCVTAGGAGAPTTNPAGGANNYAPIANPVFTGSLTLPAAVSCSAGTALQVVGANLAATCVSTGAPTTNPGGGANNYAPIASPNFTGTANVAALTIAGVPLGGVCSAGNFVSTISAAGVPTCTTPGAGSFAPATNPGGGAGNYAPIASPTFTGTTTAPILNVSTTLTIGGLPLGGTCSGGQFVNLISASGVPTCAAPTSGAPLTNPAGGQNNYAPIASPSFTGATNVATLTIAGLPLGGTCGGGQFVNLISAAGVPTCSTPSAGTFAPLTNPVGGQNNYAPLANAAFTGSFTLPAAISCTGGQVLQVIASNLAPTCVTAGGAPGGSAGQVQFNNGGTALGGWTAAQARSATGINVESVTSHGDSAYTMLATDRTVVTTAVFTAPRIWTLPAISSINPGQVLVISDAANAIGATNTLTVAGSGTDTIAGTANVVLNTAGRTFAMFWPDGNGHWAWSGQLPGTTGAAGYPTGAPPQIAGFSAANTGEGETVGGDFTFARAGANSYTGTVSKIGGLATGPWATDANTGALRGQLKATSTQKTVNAACTGSVAVTIGNQGTYECDLTGNTTIVLSAPSGPTVPAGAMVPLTIKTIQPPTGAAFSVGFTAPAGNSMNFQYTGGGSATAPTLSSNNNAIDWQYYVWDSAANSVVLNSVLLNSPTSYAAIGTCPGGQYASALGTAGPTCSTPGAGSFAPTTNPGGGANNYAPLASPTFTGTLTAPTINASTNLTIAGNPLGGTCTSPQFVQTINAAGIPTCATPSGVTPNPAFSATNSVGGQAGLAQPVIFEDAPTWMNDLGSGAEADPQVVSAATGCIAAGNPSACCTAAGVGATCVGTQTIQGLHEYTNLTVSLGATLTVGTTVGTSTTPADKPSGTLEAFVQGTCNIFGTIAGNSALGGAGNGGASGGGGGGGTAAGSVTDNSWPGSSGALVLTKGGAGGTLGGGAGATGQTPTAATQRYVSRNLLEVTGSCGSSGGAGGTGGPNGGNGGGTIFLDCGTVNFTGTMTANGGNGSPSTANNMGASGGGGGGCIITAARTYTAYTGTLNEIGGTGGGCAAFTGCGIGGNGGTGWTKQFTLN